MLPWAILPEVDYLVGAHIGVRAQKAFLTDLADGSFTVAWGQESDLDEALRLAERYPKLRIGLVDAVVIATATRLKAGAIATLDLRTLRASRCQDIRGSCRAICDAIIRPTMSLAPGIRIGAYEIQSPLGAGGGFEDGGAIHALVMELVEGPTLADRIAQRQLI